MLHLLYDMGQVWISIFHWLQEVTGTNIGIPGHTPRWYNFHSGIEGNLALFGAIYLAYWHHTCHQHHCYRWARYTTAAGDKICKTHHPDMGKGFKMTAEHILRRHKANQ